ncbi:MAG: ubiquinol-cytochrome c reductase iron-sulfur subunit [Thermodesulfovibrionales bacterium]
MWDKNIKWQMDRRDVLKGFLHFCLGSVLLILTAGVVFFAYPRKKTSKRITYIPVLDEEELPQKHVKSVRYEYSDAGKTIANKLYISPLKDGHIALSPVCSHFGCLVTWDSINREFVCPCHAGRYNMYGDAIGGPPTRPLSRLPMYIENGKVYVGVNV